MELQNAFIVLADISGYTKFIKMHRTSLIHAEQIISELLESVAGASGNPLVLNEIEGDAANFYALVDSSPEMAQQIFQQIQGFFEAFHISLNNLVKCKLCLCDSCGKVGDLKLKIILHHGEVAMRKVRNFEGPAGESVILAHRLLKNSIKSKEYILMTDDFYRLCQPIPDREFISGTEHCEGIGKVKIWYHAQPERDVSNDATRTLGKTLRQFWRIEKYTAKKFLGMGHKGNFKSLEGL